MADPTSNGDSPLPTNLVNGALALLTLIGGLYYFNSRPLASDRPVAQPSVSIDFAGEQRVEARLWEDPFKNVDLVKGIGGQAGREAAEAAQPPTTRSQEADRRINELIGSISNRSSGNISTVIIMPVMLEDGQYSEDQENRIRSRFAVVAGLGVRGFVPEDAEHIGRASIGWPNQIKLENIEDLVRDHNRDVKANKNLASVANPNSVTNVTNSFIENLSITNSTFTKIFNINISVTNTAINIISPNAANTPSTNLLEELSKPMNQGTHLDLRFEWFIPRDFHPDSANNAKRTNVLVLWLRESFFEDDPLVRLPLLLYRLRPTNDTKEMNHAAVKLIGPALSSTLQKMLPGQFPDTNGSAGRMPYLSTDVTNWLYQIDIYCATPSAMDEVLVSNVTEIPREAVRSNLGQAGFLSFHNFTVTDAQLAKEACDELKLRNVDLSKPENHLVLIAEWDTFYSRMVSLTYQAKLAVLQGKGGPASLQEYIKDYRHGQYTQPPSNFHRFYYLRGLDGQTVEVDTSSSAKTDGASGSKPRPTTVDEFRQWTPDANKAEGPSQLDYVGRLGDRLQEMDDDLKHTNAGQIKAIGVVGSDVYDTLIILQALRSRFPDVLFFTTDLDARFWHPKELKWSRNLIVVSGYGLALDAELQHGAAPFRDSIQTAQYAATLAALGDTNLNKLASVPARRFEIGRQGVVDLSVLPSEVSSNDLLLQVTNRFQLHPATFRETYKTGAYGAYKIKEAIWSVAIFVLAVVATALFWKPIRRATWKWSRHLCKSLEYDAEDFGGPGGAAVVLRQLQANSDPFLVWIRAELEEEFKRISEPDFLMRLKKAEDNNGGSSDWQLKLEEMHDKLANGMAAAFNRILKHNTLVKLQNHPLQNTALVPGDIHNGAKFLSPSSQWEPTTLWEKLTLHRKLLEIYEPSRKCLDNLLETLPDASGLEGALNPPVPNLSLMKKADRTAARKGAALKLKDAVLKSATAARVATVKIFKLRKRRRKLILSWFSLAALAGFALGASMWRDTLWSSTGQALSFGNGASAWPAQIMRFIAVVAAVCSCIVIYYRKRIAFAKTTREFRFPLVSPGEVPEGRICAIKSWLEYTKKRGWKERIQDIFLPLVLYFLFCIFIFYLSGGILPFSPVRDWMVTGWNKYLLIVAVVSFLSLTFVTIDTALRCRKFILNLGAAPTDYPEATRRHFARINGDLDESYLDEWIDVQLIAALTEQIGGMVYYPFFVFGLLLIARNESWGQWSWPLYLIIIFGLNLLLAVASALILQFAAERAKREAVANLKAKVKRLQNLAAPSKAESNATQAQLLLDEINSIRRGAFAHSWESPLFGAILLPSSGLTIVQALIWAFNR